MSDNFRFAQLQPFTLAGAGAIIGATTIILKSMKDIDGNALTMSGTFGTIGFGTLEPGNGTNEEQISFTGLTNNTNGTTTLTGVSSVTFEYPYTQTSGLLKTHAGSTPFIISNTSGFYDSLTGKADDETITGTWTFTAPNYPQIDVAATLPTLDAQFATKKYVDGVAIAGAPDASTTVKGISKISVAPVSPTSPISVGDNDPRVPTQGENDALVGNNTDIAVGTGNKFMTQTGEQHNAEKYATDTSASSTAYAVALTPIPTSLTNGMVVYAKIVNANSSTTPTLNVNSLGAKTIVKYVNTALALSDIAANMYCTFIYDSTNTVWVLQNPIANLPTTSNLIFQSTTNAVSNIVDTSEHTLITNTIPANLLGTGNVIRWRLFGTWANNNGSPTITFRLKYGSTTLITSIITEAATIIPQSNVVWEIDLHSTGATNSQKMSSGLQVLLNSTSSGAAITGFTAQSTGTSAEDSTTALALAISTQLSGTSNPPVLTINSYTVEILR